jgi:hypothetical protein
MDIITEVHTGAVEATHIGGAAPAVALTRSATASAAGASGVINGRLVQSPHLPRHHSTAHPLAGWTVLVGKGSLLRISHVLVRVKSGPNGEFAIHMKPGIYVIAGVWRGSGQQCVGARVRYAQGSAHTLSLAATDREYEQLRRSKRAP